MAKIHPFHIKGRVLQNRVLLRTEHFLDMFIKNGNNLCALVQQSSIPQ